MRFDLTDDQEMVRQTARRFFENEAPLTSVRGQYDTPAGFTRATWIKASEMGWTAIGVREAAGGASISGKPGQDLAIIAEEIGRLVGSGPFLPTTIALAALSDAPPEQDREELIAQITSGRTMIAWAFGEQANVWDWNAFETFVRFDGDDILLEGAKAYVEAGAEADQLLVTARSDQGVVQVLVPAQTAGVEVVSGRSIDFVRRFTTIHFDSVRLPRTTLLGQTPAGSQVERQYQLALLLQCAETNGALDRAFEFTVAYMRERHAFGRAIASYQALKHRLADMLLYIQSCMATTDAALEAFDARSPDASRLSRIAKAYVAAKSTAIVSDLVQMTGGIAVTWDHDLHLYERRIALNRAVLGTPEYHRANVGRLISA
jgi:alkylation response protein AidB-like acyl-CoA dehydrogenase